MKKAQLANTQLKKIKNCSKKNKTGATFSITKKHDEQPYELLLTTK